MATGDIPVTGSAQTATGSEATFPIRPTKGKGPDDIAELTIRTQGKKLHIIVHNGAGKTFDENLEDPGWSFLIRERQGSE